MRKKTWITSLMLSGVLTATSVFAAEIDLITTDDMTEETLDKNEKNEKEEKEEKEENYKIIGEKTENALKIYLTNDTDKTITGLSIRGIMDMNFSDNLMEAGQEWLPGEEVIFWCDPSEVQNLEAFEIPDEDVDADEDTVGELDPEMENAEAAEIGDTEEIELEKMTDSSETDDLELVDAEDKEAPDGETDDLSDDSELDSATNLGDFEMLDELDYDDYVLDDMDDMLYDAEMDINLDDMDDIDDLDDLIEVYDICLEFQDGDSVTLHEIPLEVVYRGSILAEKDYMYLEYCEQSSEKKHSTKSVEELYMGILTDMDDEDMDDIDEYDDMMYYDPMGGYDIDYSYEEYDTSMDDADAGLDDMDDLDDLEMSEIILE